eukprot:278631_1
MGAYFTKDQAPAVDPPLPTIDVHEQMYYILTYWLRIEQLHVFPDDIKDTIVNMHAFQKIFDKEHQFKLKHPKPIRNVKNEKGQKATHKGYDAEDSRVTHKHYDRLFKLLLIGDSGVGKSCLLLRFSDYSFRDSFITNIGIDFKIKNITIDGLRIKLQIWDTAGQEIFRTITSSYHREAHGVLMVYDITDEASFMNITYWNNAIDKREGNRIIQRIVVGNKSDLSDDRQVTFEKAQAKCNTLGIANCMEVSAKTGDNVDDAFHCLASDCIYGGISEQRLLTPFCG